MKGRLSYIVSNLVTKPEAIQIDEQSQNGEVNLNLVVYRGYELKASII